ncbi:hypothetical protein BKA61DRAFT_674737 [Leptodontidium sp. MPI-SDFR-AT-0119]|nr:hypothetical protein BKA61DRAFT_674737 [Leptodontidium sp. MPI-SDFR-AT-0119]
MKSIVAALSSAVVFLPLVQAVNMTFYNPQYGVDYEFGPFYKELLATNENPTSMSDFTDFFAPNGTLVVLGSVSQGSQEILASRQAMLPVNGSVRWNHFPNITFVAWETSATKTFQLSGIMHAITGGNCSTTYFSTRFTVMKNTTTGIANLQPHSGSLLNYDGFIIDSSEDPCIIDYEA